ncbi:MAG TPA: GGDEF domain-containing protein [Burkholderiaceae bacterium]|nr:GGDEF domain-containing protein [Burkholderiaceae bacterium]
MADGGRKPARDGAATAADDARRVLKALTERRIVPTPDSFREVYDEVTGGGDGATAAAVIKEILRDLVRQNRIAAPEATLVLERAQRHEWRAVRDLLDRVLARRGGATAGNWPLATLQLVKSIDAVHVNWTRARKLEAVARVIDASAGQPDIALERLTRLVESWGAGMAPIVPAAAPPAADAAAATMPRPTPPAARPLADAADEELQVARAAAEAWRQVALRATGLVEQCLSPGVPAREKLAEFAKQAAALVQDADEGIGAAAQRLAPKFIDVVAAVERQAADDHRIRAGLQRLLALLCGNMRTLTPEEAWLVGQLEPIRALLAGPIGASSVADAETRLTQAIAHQAGTRRSLSEAKLVVREMVSTLIDRASAMGSTTERFAGQVGRYRDEIERADDVAALSGVVRGLLADTATVQADIDRSRLDLVEAQRRAQASEARIKELEHELNQVSTLVLKDPLTHALNRRGLDEAYSVEAARATRHETPLMLVMLDIDDFKALNDRLGHVAGDQGLVHFATGLRAGLRATDIIARSGGEEFALLLPATDIDEAVALADRLVRACAATPFAYESAPIVMTCSAGVAPWAPGDTLAALMKRADAALYEAKRQGKNRVVPAK